MPIESQETKGDSHFQEGLSCLKTGLFKWKADHQGAAMSFERAATCYKVAKKFTKAIDAFKKSATSHAATGIHYTAGQHLESAASLALKETNQSDAADLYHSASLQYAMSGNLDSQMKALAKAADCFMQTKKFDDMISNYDEAFDMAFGEELTKRLVLDAVVIPYLSALVELENFSKAATVMDKLKQLHGDINQPENVCKDIYSAILLYLAAGDYESAEKYFNLNCSSSGFLQSHDGQAAQDILDAYENLDEETIRNLAKNDMGIGYLLPPISRVGRLLPVVPLIDMNIPQKLVETIVLDRKEFEESVDVAEEQSIETVEEIESYVPPEVPEQVPDVPEDEEEGVL
ncbi:hypothetical protein RCL1_001868 [Eukaryota sp. TZLM3-RCL]